MTVSDIDLFRAEFRASQTEYLSIADDGVYEIVTGGFSIGGPADGSRGGEQWPIFSDGRLRYSITDYFEGTLSDGTFEITEVDGRKLRIAEIRAEWSGESVDHFSDQDAFGNVTVTCIFVYLDTSGEPGGRGRAP